jgi:integrase
MVAELAFEINERVLVVASEFMHIDIRPENQLEPVRNLPADQQPALTYLAGLGRSSQRTMWDALILVSGVLTAGQCNPLTLPWWQLGRPHVNAVRAWLIDNRSVATGRRVMAALRGTLKECWRLELMSVDDYMRAIDVKAIRGEKPSQAAGRALSAGEKLAILQVCRADPGPAGVRDAAIFGLGIFGGLRRAEIAGLGLNDYDQANQVLTVKGKGNKTRTVHVAAGVDDALADWLHVRGAGPGALFLSINKGGRVLGAGISDAAVYDLVAKRAKAAGVKRFSPHDLRRTFAGDLLDAGADIATVQRIMGHSDSNTTAGYDRRGERSKREAIGRLHMAWERRYSR